MTDLPDPTYTPTLAEVAAYVPSRALGDYGRLTTFDDTTEPTGDQVQTLIDRAATAAYARIGEPPAALFDAAKMIVALRAAMLVELTYFGGQIGPNAGPYDRLKAMYDEAVTDYLAARSTLGADDTPGTGDDQRPYYWFPAPGLDLHAPGSELPIDFDGEPVW